MTLLVSTWWLLYLIRSLNSLLSAPSVLWKRFEWIVNRLISYCTLWRWWRQKRKGGSYQHVLFTILQLRIESHSQLVVSETYCSWCTSRMIKMAASISATEEVEPNWRRYSMLCTFFLTLGFTWWRSDGSTGMLHYLQENKTIIHLFPLLMSPVGGIEESTIILKAEVSIWNE